MMKKLKSIALLLSLVLMVTAFAGCTKKEEVPTLPANEEEKGQEDENAQTEPVDMSIAVLKGPTGIGAVKLMSDAEEGSTKNNYTFEVLAAPDEAVGKIVSGEIDIAAVPTNLAATLYNKTEGNVQMAAINTLGVLYMLENGDTIQSVKDLSGKTVYSTGQGATPEYVLNYILQQNGLDNVEVEYMAEHAELATALASGEVSLGVLPEPNVTAVTMKNPDIRIALDLTQEWESAVKGTDKEGSVLAMGCIIARKDFIENNKAAFDTFLEEYKNSIDFVNSDTEDASVLVEKYGIMASAEAAKAAIPNCNIVYIDGAEMKDSITNFFDVLFHADNKSVGGKLPDEDFYYAK